MLRIRFARAGKKGYPTYRIVVAEHSRPVGGKFVARVGSYDPHTKKAIFEKDVVSEWMQKGAKPSNSVSKLFKKEGLKHSSIIVKKFRAISQKELEAQKIEAEKEREQRAAELEAQKEAWEKESAEKAEEAAAEKAEEAAQESAQEAPQAETPAAPEAPAESTPADQPQAGSGQPS